MFQYKSRIHKSGCGLPQKNIHRLSYHIIVNFFVRDPYLIYLKTTRVPSLFFRSVDHTIKNRQQSICQRFPGLITSYSSRKVGGTSQTSNNCFKTVLIKRSKLFVLLCQFFYTCNTFFTPRFFLSFFYPLFLQRNSTNYLQCNN